MRGWLFEGGLTGSSRFVSALLVEEGVAGGGSPVTLGERGISSGRLGRAGDLASLSRSRGRLPRGEFLLGLGGGESDVGVILGLFWEVRRLS